MRLRPLRSVKIEKDICIIPLSQGKVAICDSVDYQLVSSHNWYSCVCGRNTYARTNITLGPNKQVSIKMHRQILGLLDPSIEVDHRDGNGLNNCRSNLRTCSRVENQKNKKLYSGSTSGFKGVSWNKREGKWVAGIRIFRKKQHLGYFNTKEEAAFAYNEAAVKYFGDFAKLNVLIKQQG